jgi:hypothetical protein
VVGFKYRDPASGSRHARHLCDRVGWFHKMLQNPYAPAAIEGVIRKIEPLSIAYSELHGQIGLFKSLSCFGNHRLAEINTHDASARANH